jgi:hypothetical protein
MEIFFLGLGVVVAMGMVTIGYATKRQDGNSTAVVFSIGLALLFFSLLGLGICLGNLPHVVKKKIEPTVRVECVNGTCDTIYMYEFKED